MKYINLEFPTKKKWLRNWWQKNINIFLYATENPEIKEFIENYRKKFLTGETGNTPDQLRPILRRILLKEAEAGKDLDKLTWRNQPVFREGDDYFFRAVRNKEGYTNVPYKSTQPTEQVWKFENPFDIFDGDMLAKPQWKLRLINMLASPKENGWLFEPRFLIKEEVTVYPTSHMGITTLHDLYFLSILAMHVIRRLNLDYFVFWPMFFYYALTNDIDYVIENVGFLTYPAKLFLIDEGGHSNTVLKFYGDCNFNEVAHFLKDNKDNLEQLNKLFGNPKVTGSNVRDFYMYKAKAENGRDELKVLKVLSDHHIIKVGFETKKPEQMKYEDHFRKAVVKRPGDFASSKSTSKKIVKRELARIKVAHSQVKKEIMAMTSHDHFADYKKAEKLIDKINNYSV